MNISNLWRSLGIRGKINFILIPAMVPMLAIAVIGYLSHREASLSSSENVVDLVLDHGGEMINSFLAEQTDRFHRWSQEGIYGMAIEYDTTTELGDQFEEMLADAPGMALLVLADVQGRILTARGGSWDTNDRAAALEGEQTSDRIAVSGDGVYGARFARSDLLGAVGLPYERTVVFCQPATSMNGEVNGHLLGYMDWSVVQQAVRDVRAMFVKSGFPDAAVMLLDITGGESLAHSDPAAVGRKPGLGRGLAGWLQRESNAEHVRRFDTGDGKQFVGFAMLADVHKLVGGGEDLDGSTYRLLARIPAGNVMAKVDRVLRFNMTIAVLGSLLLFASVWFFARNISQPLRDAIANLGESAENIDSAAGQVNQSSQQIASGANAQASGLEETSASMMELTSMTKANAEHAEEAASLSNEARESAQRGKEIMERMFQAINRIKESSDETAKIVKTIDEIAFQTNLLALNAAVEAARAGDAGRGFAVVAEEVRNLAQRSAEAARNTTVLIEESQQNAANGVRVSEEVGATLEQIVGNVHTVNDLVNEVSSASTDQVSAIDQIKNAITQIDGVTQNNAAISEESAAASEHMALLARDLNRLVQVLSVVVHGAGNVRRDEKAGHRQRTEQRSVSAEEGLPLLGSQPASVEEEFSFEEDFAEPVLK